MDMSADSVPESLGSPNSTPHTFTWLCHPAWSQPAEPVRICLARANADTAGCARVLNALAGKPANVNFQCTSRSSASQCMADVKNSVADMVLVGGERLGGALQPTDSAESVVCARAEEPRAALNPLFARTPLIEFPLTCPIACAAQVMTCTLPACLATLSPS